MGLQTEIAKWLFKKKASFPNSRFYAHWEDEIVACPLTEKEYLGLADQIVTKIREVVEGAKLPKFQHNHRILVGTTEWHHQEGYNLGIQAQLQAILKAMEGE